MTLKLWWPGQHLLARTGLFTLDKHPSYSYKSPDGGSVLMEVVSFSLFRVEESRHDLRVAQISIERRTITLAVPKNTLQMSGTARLAIHIQCPAKTTEFIMLSTERGRSQHLVECIVTIRGISSTIAAGFTDRMQLC